MEQRLERNGPDALLVLRGDLTVASAAALHETMLEVADVPGRLSLRFEDVTAADVSCLQLVCATHRAREKAGLRNTAITGTFPERLRPLACDLVPCRLAAENGTECLIRRTEHQA
jgi:anti-anti-sigma regulatory factor